MTQSNDKRPNCAESWWHCKGPIWRIKCSILTLNSERILLFAGEGTDSTHRIAFLLNQNDKKERDVGTLFKLAFVFVAVVLTICFGEGGGHKNNGPLTSWNGAVHHEEGYDDTHGDEDIDGVDGPRG